MRPTAEARLGIASLLVVQLVTSVAGVSLLGRMSPAIERILTENVYSTAAVEDMLAISAEGGDPLDFAEALDRARNNITEPGEAELIDRIDAAAKRVEDGESGARAELLDALRDLSELNRRSIAEADQEARQMGLAGAWAMAALGFLGFLASLVSFRRMEARVLAPIVEIDAVLAAAREGDPHRRCALPATSPEGARAMDNLNWLLDQLAKKERPVVEDARLREALVASLDRITDRTVVVADRHGAVIAANHLAWEGLGESPRALARRALEGALGEGWRRVDAGEAVFLVEGPPPPAG